MTDQKQLILVWSEKPALVKELLTKADQAGDQLGWQVAVLSDDISVSRSGEYGVDVIYQVPEGSMGSAELAVATLSQAINEISPSLVLVSATKFGLEVAPRVAERSHCGYAPWVLDFNRDDEKTLVQSMLFGGIGLASRDFTTPTVLLSIAPGVFESRMGDPVAPQIVTVDIQPTAERISTLKVLPKQAGGSGLEGASLVIDIGQGVEGDEGLEMVRSFASLLNAELACTRPVASERNWFPEWLGLSGLKISPELCLTIGVSGQIQHIIGIRNSRVIAAINIDENAAIFSQADYGVVADLNDFLPVLADRIKERGVRVTE